MEAIGPTRTVQMQARTGLQLPSRARLTWEAARYVRRLGWGAILGFACIFTAVLLTLQGLDAMRAQRSMQVRIAQAETQPAEVPVVHEHADLAAHIAAFYASLPPHEVIPEQLQRLEEVAARTGVTLLQGEYKARPDRDAAFVHYQLVLPVKADYPAVQAFLAAALRELPTLSLESITFKRERIEAREVEARLQLVLFVRAAAQKRGGQ